jgi:hypothetical protein
MSVDMRGFCVWSLLAIGLSSSACILRPGMNRGCHWPSETSRPLDLTKHADRRHLIVDAELVDELVDRYRFHQPNDQPACAQRLNEVVARTHSVSVSDVARAHDEIPDRGLNLRVNVPVAILFIVAAVGVIGRIERRFATDALPAIVTLVMASLVLSGLFVLVGEFWTSILEMIRVGSQHVGGRVARLPWKRHEPRIFVTGVVAFWLVFFLRRISARKVIGP